MPQLEKRDSTALVRINGRELFDPDTVGDVAHERVRKEAGGGLF